MRRFQISTVLMLGTLAMFLTGCSRNPMSPDLSTPTHGAETMGTQTNDAPHDVEGGTPSFVTASFDATSEGVITVGRFTLQLHKNSLRMPAQITLKVASSEATEVEVEVVPAAANDFRVPVLLSANMSDLPATDYDTIWMWNWDGGGWQENDEVSAHPNQQNVVGRMSQLGTTRVADHSVPEETKDKSN